MKIIYSRHVNEIKNLTEDQKNVLYTKQQEGCPDQTWPSDERCSPDPKIVIIGVSPGNSPEGTNKEAAEKSCQDTNKGLRGFFYRDTRNYWNKVRYLARELTAIPEHDSLLIVSHFNLGINSSGKASIESVEKNMIQWISRLLNKVIKPDLVIFFGLKGILTNPKISDLWNEGEGLKIDWRLPNAKIAFPNNGRNYYYSEWSATNALGHKMRLVIWPNHPSRPPFSSNMKSWERSVMEYTNHYNRMA